MCPTKATRMPGGTLERLSTELDLEIGFFYTWLRAILTGKHFPKEDFQSFCQRTLHCPCKLHPSSRLRILPRWGAEPRRRKSDKLIKYFLCYNPFLVATLMVLDASSFFFPSTFNPFLRSSLNDMLHVPQRNLGEETDVFIAEPKLLENHLQVVVPFLSTLPHKQKRSSSSRQARLGLPSLTFDKFCWNICLLSGFIFQ